MGWLSDLKKAWCDGDLDQKEIDKTAIVEALQTSINAVETEEPTEQTINAEIQGYIESINGSTTGIFGYHGTFGYDTSQFPVVPVIDPVGDNNPQCAVTGENTIGTLVINPNLPANSPSQFQLQFVPLDTSAGMGSFILFCPATGQFTTPQGSANGTVGSTQTVSFDASSLNCNIEDVRIGITAWGATDSYTDVCDEISAVVGTLVTLIPDQCIAAKNCFKELFGCSFDEMSSTFSNESLALVQALAEKVSGLSYQRNVWTLNGERGFKVRIFNPRTEREDSDEAGYEAVWSGASINGIPTHSSGEEPFETFFEDDTRWGDLGRGTEETELIYCIDNRESTLDLEIKDSDTRAESLKVYLGCTCSSELTYTRYQDDGTPWHSNGANVAVVPAGQMLIMTVQIHDPGNDFSGFNPIANYVGSEDQVDFISYKEKPTVTCRTISQLICQDDLVLPDNESYKPIELTCTQCSSGYINTADEGDSEGELSEDYITRGISHAGFFNTDQMNAQLQIFNQATVAGVASWQVRIVGANYNITSITPSGATAGAVQQIDNGNTYDYVIPMTGSIPGNNGNVQFAIVGDRHPQSTDTSASVVSVGVYV